MTLIYHITNLNNLKKITDCGGLWCDAERLRQRFACVGIAHEELKRKRARKSVLNQAMEPLAVGGTLADYVPFYFSNRSPMLFSIHCGNVAGYAGGQANVVYLVSSVETVVAGKRQWCFTDGHAIEAVTKFYDNTDQIDSVDWPVIRDWSWKNTPSDPDRKRRKQAEFLVAGSVPWTYFHCIGVIDEQRRQRVAGIIANLDHQPRIVIEPNWYYH